jgi:hypothetical protein
MSISEEWMKKSAGPINLLENGFISQRHRAGSEQAKKK